MRDYAAVSFYELLPNPHRFDGKKIELFGVLQVDETSGEAFLYADMDAFQQELRIDAVRLGIERERFGSLIPLREGYLSVEGTFLAVNRNGQYLEAGTLVDLGRFRGSKRGLQDVSSASSSYKANHDYASLRVVIGKLRPGMKQPIVESLLGESDSRAGAQTHCYKSDGSRVFKLNEGEKPIGLRVEYELLAEQDEQDEQVLKKWDVIPYENRCPGSTADVLHLRAVHELDSG